LKTEFGEFGLHRGSIARINHNGVRAVVQQPKVVVIEGRDDN
jgi:hypothetical protein